MSTAGAMCWSAEVSFATYAVSAATGAYLGHRSPLYWNFIHMQLLEGLMWLDQGCDRGLNSAATGLAALLLMFQPAMSYATACSAYGMRIVPEVVVVYLIATAVFGYRMLSLTRTHGLCTRPPSDGSSRHLSWKFLPPPTAPVSVAFLALFFGPWLWALWGKWDVGALGIAAMAIMVGVSAWYGHANGTWGTNWCYWANLSPMWLLGRRVFRV